MRLLIPDVPRGTRKPNNFDLIRLAMALLVVWSHSFALYLGTEAFEPISLLCNGLYNSGNIGVMVFFIVSGFLVSQSYLQSASAFDFMRKRVRRIYPGYMAATTICAFVVVPLFSTVRDTSFIQIPKTIAANLLLRNYFPPSNAFASNPYANTINGSLWSIPFEFWCYIGVAVLGISGLIAKRRFVVILALFVMGTRILLDILDRKPGWGVVGDIIGWPYLWFVILPSFLLGMIAYQWKHVLPARPYLLIAAIASAIGACWLNRHLANFVFAPALAYVTFYAAFSDVRPLQSLFSRGDFSYGTYLYAFPIQQILFATWGHALSFPIFIVLSMALSLLAGLCSWHAVEKHFIRRSPHVLSGRKLAGV